MVSVFAWSAEGRGFDHWLGQTKDIKMGIFCFSVKHAAFRSKSKDSSAQGLKLFVWLKWTADCCSTCLSSTMQGSLSPIINILTF